MSVDTVLKISTKWDVRNIQTVLESHCEATNFTINEKTHNFHPEYFTASFKIGDESYWLNIHKDSKSPLGKCTTLTMNKSNKNCSLFVKLAKVFGGYYQESDCEEKYIEFDGIFNEEDGLPYFLKYALLHNETTPDDLVSLKESIINWHKRVQQARIENMILD